jgi:hypothetical protein
MTQVRSRQRKSRTVAGTSPSAPRKRREPVARQAEHLSKQGEDREPAPPRSKRSGQRPTGTKIASRSALRLLDAVEGSTATSHPPKTPADFAAWFANLPASERQIWVSVLRDIVRSEGRSAYIDDLVSAWRPSHTDAEFDHALHVAQTLKDTSALYNYLDSDKPLTRPNRRMLSGFTDLLVPKRKRHRPDADKCELNIAWLVAFVQEDWRAENGHERVPARVTNQIVTACIEQVVADPSYHVERNQIKLANIKKHLKTGRIKVRPLNHKC